VRACFLLSVNGGATCSSPSLTYTSTAIPRSSTSYPRPSIVARKEGLLVSTTPVHAALEDGCGRSMSTSSFPVDRIATLGLLMTLSCNEKRRQQGSTLAEPNIAHTSRLPTKPSNPTSPPPLPMTVPASRTLDPFFASLPGCRTLSSTGVVHRTSISSSSFPSAIARDAYVSPNLLTCYIKKDHDVLLVILVSSTMTTALHPSGRGPPVFTL
jgi:hypothetical protein